jgi:DNA-binding MarR family transcriptional regulator
MSADGPVAVVVMQVVRTTPGCRVLDIAEALFITVGGASKVADKVQAGGWCRRLPNPSDGRSSPIELTESGESLLEAANVTFEDALKVYLGAAAADGRTHQAVEHAGPIAPTSDHRGPGQHPEKPLMSIMKAVVLEAPGPPEALQLRHLPMPTPRPGEVLIKVAASA